MNTCPDCTDVKRAAKDDPRFQLVDIGEHVHNLKEFLQLRDTHPKFEVARRRGLVGIPSFLLEDGTVTFRPAEAGLVIEPAAEAAPEATQTAAFAAAESAKPAADEPQGASCSIDGSGC